MKLVFFQVGDHPIHELFVWSARLTNPDMEIIQCSDLNTKKINGVHHVHRIAADPRYLMLFRLEAFRSLNLKEPALYVDTDMIFVRPLSNLARDISNHQIGLCRRDFDRDKPLGNIIINDLGIHEYANIPIDKIYPFLACFTYSENNDFWNACCENLRQMPEKFHKWFGDQEAIREVAHSGAYSYAYLPEKKYAVLPQHFEDEKKTAQVVHFKGYAKESMVDFARHIQLIK